jgi:hypothetical protein
MGQETWDKKNRGTNEKNSGIEPQKRGHWTVDVGEGTEKGG